MLDLKFTCVDIYSSSQCREIVLLDFCDQLKVKSYIQIDYTRLKKTQIFWGCKFSVNTVLKANNLNMF